MFNRGGLYITENSRLEMTGGEIKNNTAQKNGGGIFSQISAEIQSALISSNKALNGGGIYVDKSVLTLSESSVAYNKSQDSGGGVYIDADSELRLNGSSITDNTAVEGAGGGVYAGENTQVEGKVYVMRNEACGNPNGLFLTDTSYITIGELDTESNIGVSLKTSCGESRKTTIGAENREDIDNAFNYQGSESYVTLIRNNNELYAANDSDIVTFPAKDPGCIHNGNIEYSLCKNCGEASFESDGSTEKMPFDEAREFISIPATGEHAETLTHIEAKSPTCTEKGNTEYWLCELCDSMFGSSEGGEIIYSEDVEITANGHETVHHEKKLPTCTEEGVIEYWECTSCNGIFSDSDGENLITEDVTVPAKGHSLIHTEAKEPSCTEKGNKEYWQCSECDEKFSDENGENLITGDVAVPAKGHSLIHTEAKEHTCTEKGNKEYWQCSECDEKFSDESGKNLIAGDVAVPAKGHSLIHTEAKEPTCTEKGNKEYWQCSECSERFSDENGKNTLTGDVTVPTKEHTYDGGIITKPSTCTDEGEITYTCTDCGHTKSEAMRKLSHDVMEELQYNQDSHWEECRICRRHLHEAPHTWDEGTENPEEHIKVYSCEICGAKKTEAFEPAPDTTPTEETLPESSEPEETLPESTEPEVTLPESTEPEETLPESTEPEETLPESTEPEETLPERTEPEETLPESTEPEETLPESTEPEETLPEGTEPEETEQKTTKREESTFTESTAKEETQAGTAATDSGNNTDDGKDEGNMPTGMVISVIPAITALAAAVILKRKR